MGIVICPWNRLTRLPARWLPLLQVGDGVTNFTPTPSESRDLVSQQYSVPQTLLIRFGSDNIDETPEMANIVMKKYSQASVLTLPGTSFHTLFARKTTEPEVCT